MSSSTHNSIESSDGDDSIVSSSSTYSLQINSSDSDDESTTISLDDDDDLSLGFPIGHITTLAELNELQSQNLNDKLSITSTDQSTINPSILPSYFFCPLSQRIMIDPVMIVPTGNTYERRALLRYFIICYPNYHDPYDINKKPLHIYKDLKEDTLVKGSIDKARKDAWVRYVLNYEEESGENANNVAISDTREIIPDEVEEYSTQIQHSEDSSKESSDNEDIPKSQSPLADDQSQTTSYNKFISYMNSSTDINTTTDTTTARTSESNHGWQVPLGVHKVICSKGLTVTTDIHRRSNVVKRKIIRKSLATSDTSTTKEGTKKMKIKRIKKKKQFNVKTTTSIITRDLILLPGTYVDILETCIHGGRVRGRISFEEEVLTEVDNELLLAWEEEEVRNQCRLDKQENNNSPSKKKLSKAILSPLHHKSSKDGHEKNLPFASELFDSIPVQQMNKGQKNKSSTSSTDQSSSYLTTIKYNGWITLSWAESVNDSNEEDKGPLTQAIPLGVYRFFVQGHESTAAVSGSTVKQLPLYDASDSDQIIDFLVHNQCLEVVETQVKIRKKTDGQDSNSPESEQVVRARCIIPVIKSSLSAEDLATGNIDSKPQQKFTSGWITLVGQGEDTSVIPIPLGTYTVTSDEPLLSCDFGSNVKSTHEPGSNFEVVNTRIEFEDDTRTMKCSSCGREGKYHTIAVRALIATGGYATILLLPVGGVQGHDIKLCVCGQLVQPLSYAKPAPV